MGDAESAARTGELVCRSSWALTSAPIFADRRFLSPVLESEEGINHRVADEVHAVERNPFLMQVLNPTLFRHKEQVGHVIGNDAIDFFGHPSVERPQACFHVRDHWPGTSGIE